MRRKKLFKNKTDYLILAFLVGMAFMLGNCESAKADIGVEYAHDSNAGTTEFNQGLDRVCARWTSASDTSMVFCPLLAVGGHPKRDSFELGIADKLWGRWEGQITLNRFDGVMDGGFTVRRIIGDGPFNMFLGGTYWIDESPGSNSNYTFNLGMRYTF